MKNAKPLSDLELFEIIVAAYPEKFDENADDDCWDEVMDFAESMSGADEISDLLGRVAMLSMPMESAIKGELGHALGKVTITNNQVHMRAAVKRPLQ